MMYMTCRHIKPNGLRCESPALKGGHFCYYHSKVHTIGAEPNPKYGPLLLPAPEDPAAIQLSVARINDALINGRIDLKKATTLFYGLQIAAQFINRKEIFLESRTVQSTELAPDGDELAPGKYVCDDDDDCNDCPHSSACPRCIHDNDEDSDNNDHGDDDDNDDNEQDEDGDDESDEDEIARHHVDKNVLLTLAKAIRVARNTS
jgi:hypothetical protein